MQIENGITIECLKEDKQLSEELFQEVKQNQDKIYENERGVLL